MRLLRVTNFKIFANAVRDPKGGVKGWVKRVRDAVTAYAFGAEQSDDITMLAFSYLGSGKTDSI